MPTTTNPVTSQRIDKLIREYERLRELAATAPVEQYAAARMNVDVAASLLSQGLREHGAAYRFNGWIYSIEQRSGDLWRQRDGNARK